MFGMGIQMFLAGTWYIVMLFLIFCVWKRVRHWSGMVLLCSVALMLVLRMLEIGQIISLMVDPQELVVLPPERNYDFIVTFSPSREAAYFGWLVAFVGGGIGGIGALLALRKNKWSVQAMRNSAEAAQQQKGRVRLGACKFDEHKEKGQTHGDEFCCAGRRWAWAAANAMYAQDERDRERKRGEWPRSEVREWLMVRADDREHISRTRADQYTQEQWENVIDLTMEFYGSYYGGA